MSAGLRLTVATPLQLVLQQDGVASLRAEDASGDFGILPGHADFLTVIDAGVLRWRMDSGPWRYCALRGGVMTVFDGRDVSIACREAILGDDLATLQERVSEARAAALEEQRKARTQVTRLHARAIRHLMRQLGNGSDTLALIGEAEP